MARIKKKIKGFPTKQEADDCLAVWKVTPGYVKGSGNSYADPPGWTAEAQFDVPATGSTSSTTAYSKTGLANDSTSAGKRKRKKAG